MRKVSDKSLPKSDAVEKDLSNSAEASGAPYGAGQSGRGARRRRHKEPAHSQKEWYSKAEAAQYLGVAEITITRYLERGILHARRLATPGGDSGSSRYDYGRLRIHKSELDRYLESTDRHPDNTQTSLAGSGANQSSTGHDRVSKTSVGHYPEEEELAQLAQVGNANALERLREADLIMTREEAALRLGVSWRYIKRQIESGALRLAGYFRCPDSYTRAHVFRSDVEQLLRSE